MPLKLHNTFAREKQDFVPIDPDNVRMYVCGPTVYDNIHIGNARPLVVFDVLYRVLLRMYPKVTYVRNITDVDDKINARAQETGEDIRVLTERTAEQFHDDAAALNTLPPDVEPRATEHIPEMIALIERLIGSGHAYAAEGHVLFDVPAMPDYGRLSRHSRDALISGARVDVAPYKRDPADFVLWKPSPDNLPGWPSPWGRGRPGWHVECSAMSQKHLGEDFDIHGGGQDLIFPHHENEIAQSCCGNPGSHFARYWVHNGYLMSEGEKMSKSLGNFYSARELLDEFPGEALRLTLLQTHYRAPLDFSKDGVRQAKAVLDRWYGALRGLSAEPAVASDPPPAMVAALEDDLNTPLAITALHEAVAALNAAGSPVEKSAALSAVRAGGAVLGLLQQDPEQWFRWRARSDDALDDTAIDTLVAERAAARMARNFAESDRIRDVLQEAGVVLEDKSGQTVWRRK
ncbi:MAG: cysteine--tRNA ligase [Alphaproteobacteria bacterium]